MGRVERYESNEEMSKMILGTSVKLTVSKVKICAEGKEMWDVDK